MSIGVFLIQLYHLLALTPPSFPSTRSQNPLWELETVRETQALHYLTIETPAVPFRSPRQVHQRHEGQSHFVRKHRQGDTGTRGSDT